MADHTPTPWTLCHHLQSVEHDKSCQCGYRGGIWGAIGEILVLEMGQCERHLGADMVPVADRATQIADAHFVVEAVNSHVALKAENAELRARLSTIEQETIEKCAKIVERIEGETLAKQSGAPDPFSTLHLVDQNLRMTTVLLPQISSAIRSLSGGNGT